MTCEEMHKKQREIGFPDMNISHNNNNNQKKNKIKQYLCILNLMIGL